MTTKDVLITQILEHRPKANVERMKEQSEAALAFKLLMIRDIDREKAEARQ